MDADAVFWDRLADMPPWEAEQECVSRREKLCLENAMLHAERAKLLPLTTRDRQAEHRELGIVISQNAGQQTLLNERIKYLRNLMNRLQWKEAVKTLYGQEAFEECVLWIEQQYGHITNTRREWAGAAP